MNRVEQIEATAQRVIPVDTDTWRLAKGAALTPADAVLIAPADFHWLISNVREADRYIAASLEWMRREQRAERAEAILARIEAWVGTDERR